MTKALLISFMIILTVGCVPLRSYVSTGNPVTEQQVEKAPQPQEEKLTNLIRVAVVVCHPSVELIVPAQFDLIGISSSNSQVVYKDGEKCLQFDATVHDLESSAAFIKPQGEGEISVDGNHYKGAIELVQDQKGCLTVINKLF